MHGYGEYGVVKMLSVIAYREWNSREPELPPTDAAPMVDGYADIPVRWVQQMDDRDEQSTSTTSQAPVARYHGV